MRESTQLPKKPDNRYFSWLGAEWLSAITLAILLAAAGFLFACSASKGNGNKMIDSEHRLAFAACEENAKLVVFDLETKKLTTIHAVGADPDVLAFDKGLGRLYVSAESGVISIFDERGRNLEKVGEGLFAVNAHTIAVDQRTHRIYLPLQNVNGKPVLRIAIPADKQLQ